VNYVQDVHSLAEAGEDEATTDAGDDEEVEEVDFGDVDVEDISIELTEPIDNAYRKQQDVAVSLQESLETREEGTSFTTEAVLDDPAIDDNDSSTYVDRMDLAESYDDDVGLDTDGNTDAETSSQPVYVVATSVRESVPIDEETNVKDAEGKDETTGLLVEDADLSIAADSVDDTSHCGGSCGFLAWS